MLSAFLATRYQRPKIVVQQAAHTMIGGCRRCAVQPPFLSFRGIGTRMGIAKRLELGTPGSLNPHRPARKPETQKFIEAVHNDYDWKRYRKAYMSPRRKSASLMTKLGKEEVANRTSYEFPDVKAGDGVEITILLDITDEKAQSCKGLVLGRANKGIDTWLLLYCVVANTAVIRRIPIYSPLVKDVKIIYPNFLHKGKKRVRRAKLYYLLEQGKPIRVPS